MDQTTITLPCAVDKTDTITVTRDGGTEWIVWINDCESADSVVLSRESAGRLHAWLTAALLRREG